MGKDIKQARFPKVWQSHATAITADMSPVNGPLLLACNVSSYRHNVTWSRAAA